MADHQTQAASLDALHSTATDILNLLNVNEVFSAANQRAQALLGSDITYLAVFEETSGRTMVRASIGARSSDFHLLNVPLGAGVGGIVANSKEPFITQDYLSDPAITHVPSVDAGISAEGIYAMMALPLIARDEFLGALFVADRSMRRYTPSEVRNLQALCALVAVAIVNAKLFESKERALSDIHTAYDALHKRAAATERIVKLHDSFGNIVTQGGSCDDLIRLLAHALDIDLVLYDRTMQVLAYHAYPLAPPLLASLPCPQAVMDATIHRSLESGELEEIDVSGSPCEYLVLAIAVNQCTYGTLVVASTRVLLGSERRTLERAGHIAALLLSQGQLILLQTIQKQDELLQQCLRGNLTYKYLQERGLAMGFDLTQPATVVAFDNHTTAHGDLLPTLASILAPYGALLGKVDDDKIIAVIPGHERTQLLSLSQQAEQQLDTKLNMGLAYCDEPISQIKLTIQNAVQALGILRTSGKTGSMAAFEDLGCEGLLLNGNSRKDILHYIERTLGPLQRYDRERGASLVLTLQHYFAASQNTNKAAELLGIHPKTMVQRLERITLLLNHDWRQPQPLLQLQIALRVLDLIDTAVSPS